MRASSESRKVEGESPNKDRELETNELARTDAESEEVLSSGVRAQRVRLGPAAESDAHAAEETAIARLLFGWGSGFTVAGMIVGGLFFDPVGALLGAVGGSLLGALTVIATVVLRSRRPS